MIDLNQSKSLCRGTRGCRHRIHRLTDRPTRYPVWLAAERFQKGQAALALVNRETRRAGHRPVGFRMVLTDPRSTAVAGVSRRPCACSVRALGRSIAAWGARLRHAAYHPATFFPATARACPSGSCPGSACRPAPGRYYADDCPAFVIGPGIGAAYR